MDVRRYLGKALQALASFSSNSIEESEGKDSISFHSPD
jgi:hypothetical protein